MKYFLADEAFCIPLAIRKDVASACLFKVDTSSIVLWLMYQTLEKCQVFYKYILMKLK